MDDLQSISIFGHKNWVDPGSGSLSMTGTCCAAGPYRLMTMQPAYKEQPLIWDLDSVHFSSFPWCWNPNH